MNPYVDEDVMWQRLKDRQREAENRRLIRAESRASTQETWREQAVRAVLELTRGVRPRWWARTRPRGA